jgi:hypothetical protein
MIGAYYGKRMVGFMMIANAGSFALVGQLLSSVEFRELSPSPAMIAKAVELCAERGSPYLVYLQWGDDSLTEFKRRCGFEPARVPRYYVPLTARGRLALAAGLHRGIRGWVPRPAVQAMKSLRLRLNRAGAHERR